MTQPDLAAIQRAMTPAPASLEMHDDLMAHRERRVLRAGAKCIAADAEYAAAVADYNAGAKARAQFIADNPDPQLMLPVLMVDVA